MRIMVLANFDGGLYKFRKELLEKLVKEHEVYICLPEGEYTKRLIALGCKFIPCTFLSRRGKNPVQDLRLLLKIKHADTTENTKEDGIKNLQFQLNRRSRRHEYAGVKTHSTHDSNEH